MVERKNLIEKESKMKHELREQEVQKKLKFAESFKQLKNLQKIDTASKIGVSKDWTFRNGNLVIPIKPEDRPPKVDKYAGRWVSPSERSSDSSEHSHYAPL